MKKIKYLIITLFITLVSIINVNASSATLSMSTSSSQVVVGNTVKLTIKISSSAVLGTWKWTLSYDNSKLKMTSGDLTTVGYGDGSKKSASYTYTFKAIGTGSATIKVSTSEAYQWEGETSMSVNNPSKTVKVITQSELEASYSKNNNLSNLYVEGYDLDKSFDKDTTEYTVKVPSDVEQISINATKDDSKASVSGDGSHEVSEGDNKFEVVVTAENGSTKTYIINVIVVDDNPIKVTIDNIEYTVVKRASTIECPTNYETSKVTIEEQEVPAFTNELNKYTLVGLKDAEGNTSLFIYDNNTYTKYFELSLDKINIFPLDIDIEIDKYSVFDTTINEINVKSLKQNKDTNYSIIKARNLDTGKDEYYLYDSKTNSVVTYTDDMIKPYLNKISKYEKIIIILTAETVLLFIIFIIISSKQRKKIKKRTEIIKELEQNQKETILPINNKKEEIKENIKTEKDENKTEEIKEVQLEEPKEGTKEEIKEEIKEEKKKGKRKKNVKEN